VKLALVVQANLVDLAPQSPTHGVAPVTLTVPLAEVAVLPPAVDVRMIHIHIAVVVHVHAQLFARWRIHVGSHGHLHSVHGTAVAMIQQAVSNLEEGSSDEVAGGETGDALTVRATRV
jgi:hypothetical protein